MNLLAPLAAGFADAPSGSVDIYVRGTSTRASYFATFEGNNQVTPSAPVPLDSNGRLLAYVNVLVDCVVKDTTGTIRCQFTAGESASSVEVRSASFTGTDYETGVSGASEPNNLEAILDKWITSAGAKDWNVSLSGSSTSLSNAFATFSGLFFNVKAPAYGAKGDGTTDDGTAIANAITAAAVLGGTVFFPPGTYRVTSAISVGPFVSLLGAGSTASLLRIDHASNNLLSYSVAGSSGGQTVSGLNLTASQANTGSLVSVTAGVRLQIRECYVGGTLARGSLLKTNDASAIVSIYGTTLEMGTSATVQAILNTLGDVTMVGGDVIAPTSTFTGNFFQVDGVTIRLFGVRVNCSGISSGTSIVLLINTSAVVCGCTFINPTGGTVLTISPNGAGLLEMGNVYGSSFSFTNGFGFSYSGTAGVRNADLWLSPESRVRTYAQETSFTADTNSSRYFQLIRTSNGAQVITLPKPARPGIVINVLIWNNSGGGLTKTNAQFAAGSGVTLKGAINGATDIDNGKFSTMRFTSHDINGAAYWHGENPADNVAA